LAARQGHGSPLSDISNGELMESAKKKNQINGCPDFRFRNAQMFQLSLTAGQSTTNLAQCRRVPELAEKHGDELPPAGEATSLVFGFEVADSLFELHSWEEL